jgi:hypothetical protein
MTRTTAYQKRHAKARQRRRLTVQEHLARDRRQAQHAAMVLEQALQDVGLPENLVAEIEGRLPPLSSNGTDMYCSTYRFICRG